LKRVDITKETESVRQSRLHYLRLAKEYAKLLSEASKLDPGVLTISKDIMKTGEVLSVLDSASITDFYNNLLAHSKIDKRYHVIVREIKKLKSELENITYSLFSKQVDLALKKSGLPFKNHNLELTQIADYINDRKLSLLTKIAYATPYIKEEILLIEPMIGRKEVVIADGNIAGTTKAARAFLRDLEKTIAERVNNHLFGPKSLDIRQVYVSSKGSEANILSLLSAVGDTEHVRELTRRISAGDVLVQKNRMQPMTEKGKKYLRLLSEELSSVLESQMNSSLIQSSSTAMLDDPLISNIMSIISEFEAKLRRHEEITNKYDFESSYGDIVSGYKGNILKLVRGKEEIVSDIDKLSTAALDIRKKLILLANHKEIVVEDSLPILTALKLLSKYEQKLDQKIASLARDTDHHLDIQLSRVPSLSDIRERHFADVVAESKTSVEKNISDTLNQRELSGADFADSIRKVVGGSKYIDKYLNICNDQKSLRLYLADYLNRENRLYRGNETVQTILTEIIEKEVERRELLASITHEVQLTHKQLWLDNIRIGNDDYLNGTIVGDDSSLSYAKELNRNMLQSIEKEITNIVGGYSLKHAEHAQKFISTLGSLATMIDSNVDISKIAAELRREYRELETEHKAELAVLEREMKKLDRQLLLLSDKSRKAIEKSLISDIKKRIVS
jgi:hypothetical protein